MDASFGFDPARGIDEKWGVGSPELRFSPLGGKGAGLKDAPAICAGDKVIEGVRKAGLLSRNLKAP